MNQTLLLSRTAAIGRKTAAMSEPYGQGFNLVIEVEFSTWRNAQVWLDRTVAHIDHKALGVDLGLGFEPSGAAIARWIGEEINRGGECVVERVCVKQGDGRQFSWRNQA